MDGSGKKCSIVFIGAGSSSQVNSYLRSLPAERLSADYELLFVNAHQPQIGFAYSDSAKASIKFVETERGLGFEQLCMEATRQASGEYILFVNSPISCEQVVAATRQLEISGVNIEAPQEEKYIIVKATAFIQARNFHRLSQQQQEQRDLQSINQLIHLVAGSATYKEDVFFAVNKNRLLFENGIKHIDLTRTDDWNVYKLLFLKSVS